MKVLRTAVDSARIMNATTINKWIYYIKRIPLIGQVVPEELYGIGEVKTAFSVLFGLFQTLSLFVKKTLYVVLMAYLPVAMAAKEQGKNVQFSIFIHIMVFLSFFFSSLSGSVLLQNSQDKYVGIKLMRLPSREYLLGQFLLKEGSDLVGFFPVFMVVFALYGKNPAAGFLFAVLLISLHILGEALYLFLYHITHIAWGTKFWVVFPLMLIAPVLAYLPLFGQTDWNVDQVVFSLPFVLCVLVAGVAGTAFVFTYKRYKLVASETVRADSLVKTAATVSRSRFSDVQLKDKDLAHTNSRKFERLKGYHYLNAIFFERHKRMLRKPVWITLSVLCGLYIMALLLFFIAPEAAGKFAVGIPKVLPACVFLMYCLTANTERICRAMFNNCDISLLRYSYYREPRVILSNFKIRLFWVMRPNLLLGMVLSALLVSYALLCGVAWPVLDMLAFIVSLLLLSAFFSVHHLFLYYVFQPYTTDLGMKNPLFNFVNTAVYFVCFICLRMDSTPSYFSLLVLGATVLYICAALVLIRKYAPQNFRVK